MNSRCAGDDIHARPDLRGRELRVVAQGTDAVHTVVGGRVDLQHVHAGAGVNAPAGRAVIAGIAVDGIFAVDRLGQNLGTARLAGAARADEQVCVAQMPREDLIFQRLGDAELTDHIVKGLRPVFAVECLIHSRSPPLSVVLLLMPQLRRRPSFP